MDHRQTIMISDRLCHTVLHLWQY